jgi:hypothetical protein
MAYGDASLRRGSGADRRGVFDFRGPGHSRHQCGVALGVFSMIGPFWAMPTGLLSGISVAAAGIPLMNSVGNLRGFVGPYGIGLVRTSTGQFRGGLLLVSAALAASGTVALMVRSGRE